MSSNALATVSNTNAPGTLPLGYILITSDARYKGENLKKYPSEADFAPVRYRRIAIPSFADKVSEFGIPSKLVTLVTESLETIAQVKFTALLDATNRNLTEVALEDFTVDSLLTFYAESRAPKTFTASDVFTWSKTSSFAERHIAKFKDAARMLAYCKLFEQFATGGAITLSLAELTKLKSLFTEQDMESPIGKMVFNRISVLCDKMSAKIVEMDDIG